MLYDRARLTLVVIFAAFAFGAVAAATAQAEEAPRWSVNKVKLGSGETRFITTRAYSNFKLEGLGAQVTCTGLAFSGGVILGSAVEDPGRGSGIAEFEKCSVANNGASCKVVNERVRSVPLGTVIVQNTGKEYFELYFHPLEGGLTLAIIKFEGTCIEKEITLTGTFAGEFYTDPNNGKLGERDKTSEKKEEESWLINFPTTQIEKVWFSEKGGLEVGTGLTNTEGKITGTALVFLTAGKPWGPLL